MTAIINAIKTITFGRIVDIGTVYYIQNKKKQSFLLTNCLSGPMIAYATAVLKVLGSIPGSHQIILYILVRFFEFLFTGLSHNYDYVALGKHFK